MLGFFLIYFFLDNQILVSNDGFLEKYIRLDIEKLPILTIFGKEMKTRLNGNKAVWSMCYILHVFVIGWFLICKICLILPLKSDSSNLILARNKVCTWRIYPVASFQKQKDTFLSCIWRSPRNGTALSQWRNTSLNAGFEGCGPEIETVLTWANPFNVLIRFCLIFAQF